MTLKLMSSYFFIINFNIIKII